MRLRKPYPPWPPNFITVSTSTEEWNVRQEECQDALAWMHPWIFLGSSCLFPKKEPIKCHNFRAFESNWSGCVFLCEPRRCPTYMWIVDLGVRRRFRHKDIVTNRLRRWMYRRRQRSVHGHLGLVLLRCQSLGRHLLYGDSISVSLVLWSPKWTRSEGNLRPLT